MFDQHQPTIGRWAQAHPANFAKVQLLAILSARQPFPEIHEDYQAVLRGDTRSLFAWKHEAWRQAELKSAERLAKLKAIEALRPIWGDQTTDAALLVEVTQWYGLGLIKGGFVLQLTFGRVGCLDTRNQHDFGLDARALTLPYRLTDKQRRRLVRRYIDQCNALGGCAYLWDTWCSNYVRGRLSDPWEVSAEHCRILGLDPGVNPADIPFPYAMAA